MNVFGSSKVPTLIRGLVPMPKPPRISAVGDWGPAIFQEINESLQDSQSIATPKGTEAKEEQHANPHLSSSSSIYSEANTASRHTSKQLPGERRSMPQVLVPGTANSNRKSTLAAEQPRRESDASSHQAASGAASKEGSRAKSGTNSHRHTREIGDLYDSYWRQSRDDQAPGSSRQSRETSQAPRHSEEMGKSTTHCPVNGRGEMGRERRPGQSEVRVATIAEVPTPMASPMRSPHIGKAM